MARFVRAKLSYEDVSDIDINIKYITVDDALVCGFWYNDDITFYFRMISNLNPLRQELYVKDWKSAVYRVFV